MRPGRMTRVAAAVWMAAAALQKQGVQTTFSITRIEEELARQGLCSTKGVDTAGYIRDTCTANVPAVHPRPYRLLYLVGGAYRLYRERDPDHPSRGARPMVPLSFQIPPEYMHLLEWYEEVYRDYPYGKAKGTEWVGSQMDDKEAIWTAVAALHKIHGRGASFTELEIVDKVYSQDMCDDTGTALVERMRDLAANAPAGMGGQVGRLLYRTSNRYRLYRRGDAVHPDRKKGLYGIHEGDVPEEYQGLVGWYYTVYDPHPGY